MTLTDAQFRALKPGDFVWLPSQFNKYRVIEIQPNPEPNWRNTEGKPTVVAHRVILPHTTDPLGEVEVINVEAYLRPENLTLGTRFYNPKLSENENQVLDQIHFSGTVTPTGRYIDNDLTKAILVWEKAHIQASKSRPGVRVENRTVNFGPCKWAQSITTAPGVEKDPDGNIIAVPEFWEPFDEFTVNYGAGLFTQVRRSDVIIVRHIDAVGIILKPEIGTEIHEQVEEITLNFSPVVSELHTDPNRYDPPTHKSHPEARWDYEVGGWVLPDES